MEVQPYVAVPLMKNDHWVAILAFTRAARGRTPRKILRRYRKELQHYEKARDHEEHFPDRLFGRKNKKAYLWHVLAISARSILAGCITTVVTVTTYHRIV